jgi:hypothetical protein
MAQKFRDQGLVHSNCGIWLNPRSAAAVQCIGQIMGGDGAELRCSSAYILGHGVPSLSRREGQQSLQAGVVGSPCAGP